VTEHGATAATPKKKHSKRTAIGAILGSVAVVLGALWGVDAWARQQVADHVAEKVQQVLSLGSDQAVRVRVGGFSVIAQVLAGSFDELGVDVDSVQMGDLTGGVTLTAKGVPIDLSKPVGSVQIEFRVSEKNLQAVAQLLSATAIDKVELVGPEVRFTSELTLFGFPLNLGVGVEPFADHGQIGFTPTSLELNGSRTSAADLVGTFGAAANAVLQTRSFCVARWLPAALNLDEVVVRDKELVVTIGAKKAIFDDASVRTLGTCPGGD
jgi:hypothetical protein